MWEEQGGICTCGYNPITQHNVINNRFTGKSLVVGRVCIKHFFNLQEVETLWSALDRLKADPTGGIPMVIVDEATNAGWLTYWETRFCKNVYRKRKFSHKQLHHRERIARKILRQVQSKPDLSTLVGG